MKRDKIFRDRLCQSTRDHSKPPLRAFNWAKTTLGRLSLMKPWPSPVAWPGKVHSCSPVVPKLMGHWFFWLRQPPLLIPAVPHREQEIRQGEQFSLQLPGSAPAQETKRKTPSTPSTIAAVWPKSPRLFLLSHYFPWEKQPGPLLMNSSPIRLAEHDACYPGEHSSAALGCWGGGLCSSAPWGGWRAGFPPVSHTGPALPEGARRRQTLLD